MDKHQLELLNKMLSKLAEAKTYTNIRMVLTLLFILDFVLVLFGYSQFDFTYFLILFVTFIGSNHMDKKYKNTMKKYEELKEEYENTI